MRRVVPASLALAALLLLDGCATAGRPFRCPSHGGAPWRELASDHFVVRTDLDRDRALELLHRLERMRAAVLAALFDGAQETPGRVEVVAFRSNDEYREFAPPGVTAYYLRYAGGPPRIVLSGEIAPWQRSLLAHELTHHYLSAAFLRMPRWLSEGLAVYMESLGDQPPGRGLVVGGTPMDRLVRVRGQAVPVKDLLAWDGATGPHDPLDYYATSWLLVHYLAHRRTPKFEELQRRLAAGDAPEDAWQQVFAEFDPARPARLVSLDRTLAAYARSELQTRTREIRTVVTTKPFEQLMPSAEVHAVRLALWSQGPKKSHAALRTEVAEALAEAPSHPVALHVKSSFEGEDAVALARRAVRAHPDDPRAWTFLATSLGDGDREERQAAYRRAVELAPDNPAAMHNLAAELLGEGRSGEALPLARRAVKLAPWSPPLLAGYAAVLSDLGRCAEAIPHQQRALDALPDRAPMSARIELNGGLKRYAEQCRFATKTTR